MKTSEDYLLDLLYLALAGLAWYLMERLERRLKPKQARPKSAVNATPAPPRKRKSALIQLGIVVLIIGLIYGVPEYFGRGDATEV